MRTTVRINELVKAAIPKGSHFKVVWEPTGIGKWRILRVITPAWKSLPRFERIQRLQQAVEPNLSSQEREKILRFSVLTPTELRRLEEMRPSRSANGHHKAAA